MSTSTSLRGAAGRGTSAGCKLKVFLIAILIIISQVLSRVALACTTVRLLAHDIDHDSDENIEHEHVEKYGYVELPQRFVTGVPYRVLKFL